MLKTFQNLLLVLGVLPTATAGLCSSLCTPVDNAMCAWSTWLCHDYVALINQLVSVENAYQRTYVKMTWIQNQLAHQSAPRNGADDVLNSQDSDTASEPETPFCVFDVLSECDRFCDSRIMETLPLILVPPCPVEPASVSTPDGFLRQTHINMGLAYFSGDLVASLLYMACGGV